MTSVGMQLFAALQVLEDEYDCVVSRDDDEIRLYPGSARTQGPDLVVQVDHAMQVSITLDGLLHHDIYDLLRAVS